jgi:hypothetical protein
MRGRGRGYGAKTGGKTYPAFQAHIAGLATNGSIAWTSTSIPYAERAFRTTAGSAAASALIGQPWGSFFGLASVTNPAGVIRHGLPSEAVYNAQCSAGREVFIRFIDPQLITDLPSVDRNGLVSTSFEGDVQALRCTELIYWDGENAQRMNPFGTSGPTLYNF